MACEEVEGGSGTQDGHCVLTQGLETRKRQGGRAVGFFLGSLSSWVGGSSEDEEIGDSGAETIEKQIKVPYMDLSFLLDPELLSW